MVFTLLRINLILALNNVATESLFYLIINYTILPNYNFIHLENDWGKSSFNHYLTPVETPMFVSPVLEYKQFTKYIGARTTDVEGGVHSS